MLNAVIDLSHHNTISSFAAIKGAGVLGVIHKATQGTGYTDPAFAGNSTQIQVAGLLLGAYHFGEGGDAAAQASHFLSVAGKTPLLVLDFEANTQGQTMSVAEAEQFVQQVYSATGRYPGLYSGASFLKQALAGAGITSPAQTVLSKCWLWVAEYAASPQIPPLWQDWTLWQYTDGVNGDEPRTVGGVTGGCDRDQFNGSAAQLAALWQGPAS
ncbi:lysozyme [Andreprevotia lacus DSM 23236]|jgi:lysozyme|uniref:Lysozyme n=1 Tax=Andreprevotia lacus DSM 23236 TaxID=1121001 RepID=A0A1W1XGK1_9NEIS|nr:glycoside hydrolase family 25 protein [Andreprevotia lacus]SMC23113.1 lysozyme [Andreprevotia lacus DSM 23236]